MGCGRSALPAEDFRKWQLQFSALQLSGSEINRLYRIFRRVDMDGSGNISVAELLTHIDVERTRFTERVFSIFDEDGSGEIDFREFVLSLWNYCTLTKATLDMFSFDLYDRDGSGELSAKEVKKMLRDIYGSDYDSNFHARNIKNELKAMEKKGRPVDVEEFRIFSKNHQALLFPAFQMQLYLQKRVLGKRFWERNAKRRIQLSKGKFIPIGKLLEMHVNQQLMSQTLGTDIYTGLERAQSAKLEAAIQREKSMKMQSVALQTAEITAEVASSLSASSKNGASKKLAQQTADNVQQLREEAAAGQHTWLRRNVNGDHAVEGADEANADIAHGADMLEHADHVKIDAKAKVALGTTGSRWKRKQQLYVYDSSRVQPTGTISSGAVGEMPPPLELMTIMEEMLHQPTKVLGLGSQSLDTNGQNIKASQGSPLKRGADALSLKSVSADTSSGTALNQSEMSLGGKRKVHPAGIDSQLNSSNAPSTKGNGKSSGNFNGYATMSRGSSKSTAGTVGSLSPQKQSDSNRLLTDFPGLQTESGDSAFGGDTSMRKTRLEPVELPLQPDLHTQRRIKGGEGKVALKAVSYDQYQPSRSAGASTAKVVPLTADALKEQQRDIKPLSTAQKLQKPTGPSAVKSIFDDPVGAARAKAVGKAMQRAESSSGNRLVSLDPSKMGTGVKPTRRRSII